MKYYACKSRANKIFLIMILFAIVSLGCNKGITKETAADTIETEMEDIYAKDVQKENLPTTYSLLDENIITLSRNQGNTGMCWAYTLMNVAETNLIKNGFEDVNEVDLSEGHLCYYAYRFNEDRDTDSVEDGIYFTVDKKENGTLPYYAGGSCTFGAMQFANGVGPVYEKDAPLDTLSGNLKKSIVALTEAEENGTMCKYMGKYLLKELSMYYAAEKDVLKKAIMQQGAMGFGMTLDKRKVHVNAQGQSSYYQSGETITGQGHAAMIIGWDDDYAKENFGEKSPKENGAWLVQDSTKLISQDGFFWLSYENENAVIHTAFTLDFAKGEEYGNILFYDSMGPADMILGKGKETTIANCFLAEEDNSLKAVGIYTLWENQPVKLEIYKNLKSAMPEEGELAGCFEVMPECAGYHVIDLEKKVSIKEGERFSIVVHYAIDSVKQLGYAPVEGDSDSVNIFKPQASEIYIISKEGESFVCLDDTWYDLSKEETAKLLGKEKTINNACIKALMER